MQLPEVDHETFVALLVLLEGVENRRQYPQEALTYHQEKKLAELVQKMRFGLAAEHMPSDPPAPLPKGVVSSVPPEPHEPTIFSHWDTVMEKADSTWRAQLIGMRMEPETVSAATRIFYDICLRAHQLSPYGFPDLSLHVEPLFKQDSGTEACVVRLAPKTSMGRRYILSRQT